MKSTWLNEGLLVVLSALTLELKEINKKMYIRVYVCMYTFLALSIYLSIFLSIYLYIYRLYSYLMIYIYVYTYIYIYTHVYIYIPRRGVGRCMALTGWRLTGSEALATGLATHLAPGPMVPWSELLRYRDYIRDIGHIWGSLLK